MEATRKTNKLCEAAICYTGDILDPKRDKYGLTYYVNMARDLEKMGAHILAIKDMAGLLKPFAAHKLVKALREEVGLPVHFHTHDTSGVSAASIVKATEAGVDAVDGAVASMSGMTSQPNLNSLVAAFENTPRATGLALEPLNRCSDYWETVRSYYLPFDNGLRAGTADVYMHEMPGGQFTNLKEQAESMGLGSKWNQIARAYAEVNLAFGDIVKVTPSSKVVGDLAIFLVSHDLSMADIEKLGPDHTLTLPNSVIEMFEGSLGEPPGGWPKKLTAVVLKGGKPKRGRPGANLPAVDFQATATAIEKKTGRKPSPNDVLSYVMYPDVYVKFAKSYQQYGNLEALPTPQFFYGMKQGEEVTIELEPGKTLIVKYLTTSEPHPDGTRTVFFELNGQPREITVRDRSLQPTEAARAKADSNEAGQVGAPIPGAVSSVAVENGQKVKKGERLLIIEAMKMQTTVYAPIGGVVKERHVQSGQQVEAKDLLVTIG